jgi:hypothetical protein
MYMPSATQHPPLHAVPRCGPPAAAAAVVAAAAVAAVASGMSVFHALGQFNDKDFSPTSFRQLQPVQPQRAMDVQADIAYFVNDVSPLAAAAAAAAAALMQAVCALCSHSLKTALQHTLLVQLDTYMSRPVGFSLSTYTVQCWHAT